MEEIEEVKLQNGPQGHEISEEEDKVIHMLESSQTNGRNYQAASEIEECNSQAMEERKVMEKLKTGSSKKPKQSSKQIPKTKNTIPRPFSLATEKRMNVDRHRSADAVKPPKPTLTKSASLNYKNFSRPSSVADKTRDKRTATPTRPTSKTSLRPGVTADNKVNKKVENGSTTKVKVEAKEVEKKTPQVTFKEGDGMGSNKPGNGSTFKALPLPSFYQQKGLPPKPEMKKIAVTHSKPPMFGQVNKQTAVPKSKSSKSGTVEKPKKVARASSFGAKETITKLLKPTRSSLSTTRDIVKSVVSCA